MARFQCAPALLMAIAVSGSAVAASPTTAPQGANLMVVAPAPSIGDNVSAVPIWDLAVNSPSGRSRMMHRLNFAIASLCDGPNASADPTYSLKCSNAAWQSVQARLDEINGQR